jgi:hypothetical protein
MKITKTKQVVTEEIEVNPGTYYFSCAEQNYNKIVLEQDNGEDVTDFIFETVIPNSDLYGIRIRKDWVTDEEDLPYKFLEFILGKSGKKIEEEEYNEVKQEILKRL